MNRKILKTIMLFLSFTVSTLSIFLIIYGKIKNNSFIAYDSILFGIHIYLFYFNMIFCIIGFILFIRYLIYTNDKTFSEKYILLVPSIVVSLLFFCTIIMTFIGNLFTGGMEIPALILAIGSPLYLFYNINQKINIIIKIILCLIFPINSLISCLLMWLLMMY
jgi:hypothetical protein